MLSALVASDSMTPSLSDTFDPPSTTAYGRFVEAGQLLAAPVSPRRPACRRSAAAAWRRRTPRPACGAPPRSRRRRKRLVGETSSASCLARASRSASSLLVSRGSKRMFSSSRTSPSVSPSARASASAPDDVAGQLNVPAQLLAERGGDRRQRQLGIGSVLGTAQVRGDHHLGAGLDQRLQRRRRGGDAARVGDDAVIVEWHIQIGAHQHAAPRNTFRQKIFKSWNEITVYSDLPTSATRSTRRLE